MVPLVMRLMVRPKQGRGFNLWLPVILIWVLVAALLLLLLPFVLLAALLTWRSGPGKGLLLIYPLMGGVLWNLAGLHVEVASEESEILFDFR